MEKNDLENYVEEYVDCLICGNKNSLRVAVRSLSLPEEGDVILLSLRCNVCGYKTAELYPISGVKRKTISVKIASESDLNKIVYVFGGSKIIIPELNLEAEIKKSDVGFVTTIEGILIRFLEKTESLCKEKITEECTKILTTLNEAIDGKIPLSLIIENLETPLSEI